jgi:uncharacterized protein (TIGR02145 family)
MKKNLILFLAFVFTGFSYLNAQFISIHKADGTTIYFPILDIDSITFGSAETINPPIADFISTRSSGFAPLDVVFSDMSLNNPDSWHWNFGDGETSHEQNPTHIYEVPGIYSVQLLVANEIGQDSLLKTDYIEVMSDTSFVCGECPVYDYDGNAYNTVLIKNQCWMKENLKTTHYSNGTPIEYPGIRNNSWNDNTTGAYAWYNHDINWRDLYGTLYNWFAVINANGLCPTGWHVPTDTEFTDLTDYLGGLSVAGGKMKSVRTAPDPHPMWESPNTGATNESNWSGIPGGKRSIFFDFSELGYSGYWWTSTEASPSSAYWLGLSFDHKDVIMSIWGSGKTEGLSVRCIKDY